MKPDWKDAPEWANYLCQEKDGEWVWFAKHPTPSDRWNYWEAGATRSEYARPQAVENDDWKNTLERRPAIEGESCE